MLATDVVSELARPHPAGEVIDRVDSQDSANLVITAVTAGEIRAGVALLPAGRRRRQIAERMEALITETFAGYALAFDVDSTEYYANVVAVRTRAGRPISGFDAQIAAVCAQHGATLATRNLDDFDGLELDLINPSNHHPQ